MTRLKSLSLDGFSPNFHQSSWHIVGEEVTSVVLNFFNDDLLIVALTLPTFSSFQKLKVQLTLPTFVLLVSIILSVSWFQKS